MKQNQTQRILTDLLQGLEINWFNNPQRYGTSARSRIAELRASGYKIEDRWEDSFSGAKYKVYFMNEETLRELHSEEVA